MRAVEDTPGAPDCIELRPSWRGDSRKMTNGLIGRKLGMTQVCDDAGRMIPVTVIEAGPCRVAQVKTRERDAYEAVQLVFGEVAERKLGKAALGHLKAAQVPPGRWLREFKRVGEAQVGQVLNVDLFQKGDRVDVEGVSKGKGFQGVIKRHHIEEDPKPMGPCSIGLLAPSGAAPFPPGSGKIRPFPATWAVNE